MLIGTSDVEIRTRKKLYRILIYALLCLVTIAGIAIVKLNIILYTKDDFTFSLANIFQALFIIQIARVIDWILNHVFVSKYFLGYETKSDNDGAKARSKTRSAKGIIPWIIYLFTVILIIKRFGLDPEIFQTIYDDHVFSFKLSNILNAILVLFFARLAVWVLTQVFMYGVYKQSEVDVGRQYALNQLLSYVIYVFAAVFALQYLGIKMTLIWGGAAALLVGVGLGLQEVFNDLISGVILLFDRAIQVGDVIRVNDKNGTIRKIGLRSSIIEVYDNTAKIIPNRILVNSEVVSLSYKDKKIRFEIKVGVAYGSDTKLVRNTLIDIAKNNPYISDHPAPFVRFQDFGDSSLDFSLFFFSRNFYVMEDVKSDLRFEINHQFKENKVEIPFPQRDVWMRKSD